MHRKYVSYLLNWKKSTTRKPLIIRGARQVGKTYLVRQFGSEAFENLVELNFERKPGLAELFLSKNPARILSLLEAETGLKITPGRSLIFLDEIQAAPQVIETLRYFLEDKPDIHVIAAGSLLEFTLEQPPFPVPVGRVEYMYLGPLDFGEFLVATGRDQLCNYFDQFDFTERMPESLHQQGMEAAREFMLIGGMPAAVSAHICTKDMAAVEQTKQSILESFIQDFGKYAGRTDPQRIRKVFDRLPLLVGRRMKYSHIDREDSARNLAHALCLLNQALVTAIVCHSSSNGIPLRAEVNESIFKPLFLDVGLMSSACGLKLTDFVDTRDVLQINQGAISEQFVGQHLLYGQPCFIKPEVFFWSREHKTANAEVDYVISTGSTILPVEVKSGKSGTLKSMQVFLTEKGRRQAVRINAAPPELHDAAFALPGRSGETYRLMSIPLYLISNLRRLIGRFEKEQIID
jgi:predicted AAA+ superfamily ATPase